MDATTVPDRPDIGTLLPILRSHGRCPTSFLSLLPDKEVWPKQPERGFLAYRPVGHVDVILGDPIAPREDSRQLLSAFLRRPGGRGREVAALAVTDDAVHAYEDVGFRGRECGAEAVVELDRFDIAGLRRRSLRRGIRHAARSGVVVSEIVPVELGGDGYSEEFRRITADWVKSRRTSLLSFIVGAPFMRGWQECRHFVSRSPRRLEAFGIFYPIYPSRSVYVDITRRRLDAPNGTIDLLLAEAFRALAAEGVRRAYMGMVPCTFAKAPPDGPWGLAMAYLFRYLDALYPMRTERFFKEKFATRWERRHALFHPRMSLRAIRAIYRAVLPAGARGIVGHKLETAAR